VNAARPAIRPEAGHPPDPYALADILRLVTAYYVEQSEPGVPTERVSFGTSGRRVSSLSHSFNERHSLAITQAICLFRRMEEIDGPLSLGCDTRVLSRPACATALELVAANDVPATTAANEGYTPTPVISRAIVAWNRAGAGQRSDGFIITPSRTPPEDPGLKYNPPHGGPASTEGTRWIDGRENALLSGKCVVRVPYERALHASGTRRHDYVTGHITDLAAVLEMEAIRASGPQLAVDAQGGTGIDYWARIGERDGLHFTALDDAADHSFRFMRRDSDGKIRKIRMGPSSSYAMKGLIGLKDGYDLASAWDTDHDRHGFVTRSAGLMPPNHSLAVMADHLLAYRTEWKGDVAIARNVASSGIIDRVAAQETSPARDAGRLQRVRRWAERRHAWLRRGGKCQCDLPRAKRPGLDKGQGRHRRLPALRRDHGSSGKERGRPLCLADRRDRAVLLPTQ
jgi:phosphoglucomutase